MRPAKGESAQNGRPAGVRYLKRTYPPADSRRVTTEGRATQRRRAGCGLLAIALLALAGAAGCSRGDAAPRGRVVKVHERDFKLTASVERVHAGLVTFRVHNTGPSTHEFLVSRSEVPADALPLRANALSVNEDSKQLHAVDEIGELRLGSTHELTVRLTPGRYALFCNLEGHYRGGMYVTLDVVA
jgi:uncharacterized cupredoxin-like copper-binding protein